VTSGYSVYLSLTNGVHSQCNVSGRTMHVCDAGMEQALM